MSMYQDARIASSIRAWLGANNKARESKDAVDVARAGAALKTLVEDVSAVKKGHLKIRPETGPLLLLCDSLFSLSAHVQPLFVADRPSAHNLVRFLRDLEETIRGELEELTGESVPPRSTAHDGEEDKALSASRTLPRPTSSASLVSSSRAATAALTPNER